MEVCEVSYSSREQDSLFFAKQSLVHAIAWRIHRRSGRHAMIEDLIAYGQIGLLNAIRAFKAGHGVKFETYAWHRIQGAILDGLSEMSWFKRAAFERGDYELQLNSCSSTSENTTGKESLQTHSSSVFGQLAPTISGNFDDTVPALSKPADAHAMHQELLAFLRNLIGSLPPKEAGLIKGTFLEGRTLTEAARRVGISKAWASRLQAKTIANLRLSLEAAGFHSDDLS